MWYRPIAKGQATLHLQGQAWRQIGLKFLLECPITEAQGAVVPIEIQPVAAVPFDLIAFGGYLAHAGASRMTR